MSDPSNDSYNIFSENTSYSSSYNPIKENVKSKINRFDEAELEEQRREEVTETRRALMSLPHDVSVFIVFHIILLSYYLIMNYISYVVLMNLI